MRIDDMDDARTLRVHRVTLLIVDHDDVGEDEIADIIENVRYPNRCINPQVVTVETREVQWTDAHPLNADATRDEAFAELFADGPGVCRSHEACCRAALRARRGDGPEHRVQPVRVGARRAGAGRSMMPRLSTTLAFLLAGLALSVVATELRLRVDDARIHGSAPVVDTADACAPVVEDLATPPADLTTALVALQRHAEQLADLRLALDTLVRVADPRVFGVERVPVLLGEGWSRIGEARERVRVQSWDGTDEGNRVRGGER